MNKEKKHSGIAIVIGTKAELIKTFPIMLELQKRGEDYWFIHTGQHPLGKASEDFGIKRPDIILSKEPKISTKFWSKINRISLFWFFSVIFNVRNTIKKLNPKYVIYHGDTMSTAAAAVGSSKLLNSGKRWKNVHLEAGLRSGSLFEPFPEEISRQISDRFSDVLLAVSDRTESNLRKYKKRGKGVYKLGNTIVDSANITYKKSKKKEKKLRGKYALINIHRHENLNNKKRMEKVMDILENIGINALWPLHDNTEYYLKKYDLFRRLKSLKNIEIMPLRDYESFIELLANCDYLITDGGSIQEESLVFKKPCLLLRKKTERQEGLETGLNFLTDLNLPVAKKNIKDIENKKMKIKNFVNPYGEAGVSKEVLNKLLK